MHNLNPLYERLEDLGRKSLKIIQDERYFCFGIDAVLLSWFAAKGIKTKSRVTELCAGTGVISLLLYGRTGVRHIDALEIQTAQAALAKRNAALNHLTDVLHVYEGDLCTPPASFRSSWYDAVVVNPPYMPVTRGMKSPKDPLAIARHEIACTFEDVAEFARIHLKDRGKLYLVHRADRLGDIFATLRSKQLEPKRLCCVHPFVGRPANLVLVEATKKGQPSLIVEPPLIVYRPDGRYTDLIDAIYQDEVSTENPKCS